MGEGTTTPVDPQAGDTGNPQPDAATTTTTDPHAGDSQETISLEEARKIRSESTNLRKRLKDSETLLAELKAFKEQKDTESLSEQEKQANASRKLQEQLTTLQSEHENTLRELQQTKLAHAVSLAAQKLGFHDPSDAMLNIDQSKLNEDYSNTEQLLKEVLSKKAYLAAGKQAQTSGGATNPSRSQASNQQLPDNAAEGWRIISELQKNPDEYNRRNADGSISRWIADPKHQYRYGQKS